MNRYVLKLIAACEVSGALIGLFILYQTVRSANYQADLLPVFIVLVGSLCIVTFLALLAGGLLWTNRSVGLKLSLLVQALQVPVVTSSVLKLQLMFGIGIWVVFGFDEQFTIGIPIKFGAAENVAFNPDLPFSVGVNLVAIYFIYILVRELLGRSRTP